MNLTNILYQPYFIIIVISIIITVIGYFIINNDNKDKEEEDKINVSKTLLYTFVISLVLLTLFKYIFSFLHNKNYFQKGGNIIDDVTDKLTIMADDVDVSIFEN